MHAVSTNQITDILDFNEKLQHNILVLAKKLINIISIS